MKSAALLPLLTLTLIGVSCERAGNGTPENKAPASLSVTPPGHQPDTNHTALPGTNTPILIGYFPRRTAIPSGPRIPPQVIQLGNAGHCDGLRPDHWAETWRHNELGLYDSVPLAWSVTRQDERDAFEILAYRMYPVLIINGRIQVLQLPQLNIVPLSQDWERLGFDPVTFNGLIPEAHQQLKTFGHSPLSPFCNGRCSDIAVNRFCLLDTAADGFIRALEFSSGGGEPEPYVVVEVWRKRGPAPAARPPSDL